MSGTRWASWVERAGRRGLFFPGAAHERSGEQGDEEHYGYGEESILISQESGFGDGDAFRGVVYLLRQSVHRSPRPTIVQLSGIFKVKLSG